MKLLQKKKPAKAAKKSATPRAARGAVPRVLKHPSPSAKNTAYSTVSVSLLEETPHPSRNHIFADEVRQPRHPGFICHRKHGTVEWLVIYTLHGSGCIRTSESEFITKPGTAVLFEPHAMQIFRTNPEVGHWHEMWVHFQPRPHWAPWLHWPREDKGVMMTEVEDLKIRHQLQLNFHQCKTHCHERNYDLAMNSLERTLIWMGAAHPQRILDERVKKALDQMAGHMKEPFSLPGLARQCGLSVSGFSRLFLKQIGVSPLHYLEELRLDHAAQLLLTTGMNVSEVATETGYDNAFYFSSRFRKRFACSPTDYRRERSL